MNYYNSTSSCNAHNIGVLAALRAKNVTKISLPQSLVTEEERQAWEDGVNIGLELRKDFEPKGANACRSSPSSAT